MTNEIQLFNYGDNAVRTIEKDGEVWFVAKDVCDILEISKYRDAISRLDEDERASVKVDTLGEKQEMIAINEAGVYTLTMRSNKPEAKKFRRWVTHEVIPQIMRTGSYSYAVDGEPELPESSENENTTSLKYVSRGIMSSARKIFEHALDCKEEKDFQVTLALDKVFQEATGVSALDIGGFKLVSRCDIESYDGCVYTRTNERFEWEHDLPKLPEY